MIRRTAPKIEDQQALRPDNQRHGAEDRRATDVPIRADQLYGAENGGAVALAPDDQAEYCFEGGRAVGARELYDQYHASPKLNDLQKQCVNISNA